jgi:Trp operon repressor
LFAGTAKDNVQDMIQKDRRVIKPMPNQSNPNAVLSDEQVLEMRALRGVMTQRALAQRFGVGTSQVSRIMRCQSRSITT